MKEHFTMDFVKREKTKDEKRCNKEELAGGEGFPFSGKEKGKESEHKNKGPFNCGWRY